MATTSPEGGNESKKPNESDFSQQKLPAWQPILTAGTVLPAFFVIGIAFVAIGVGLLHFSNELLEFQKDYTNCKSTIETEKNCWQVLNETKEEENPDPCMCEVEIEVTAKMNAPVYMYYGLTNFYQNHRRYVKSRDESQLLGDVTKTPKSDCTPFAEEKIDGEGNTKPIVPCGAIANSLFNDSITLFDENGTAIKLNRTGIAWESDKKYKFRNPDTGDKSLEDYLKEHTVSPPAWRKNLWELDLVDEKNNGLQNEDLIVWMRTAAFPNFRKLYRRIEQDLEKGKYKLRIDYNYRVDQFDGTKSIYLSDFNIGWEKSLFGSDLHRRRVHLPFDWYRFPHHSHQIRKTDNRHDGHGSKRLKIEKKQKVIYLHIFSIKQSCPS